MQGPESIAFESNRNGNSQIFTMNPDGSNVVQLTDDPSSATDTLPSISPNGHTVVYQSDVSGTDQIWAINGDGTNPRQLTSDDSNVQPTFSPDGKKIAFDSDRGGYFQLFVMNADGSGQTQVMTTDGARRRLVLEPRRLADRLQRGHERDERDLHGGRRVRHRHRAAHDSRDRRGEHEPALVAGRLEDPLRQ